MSVLGKRRSTILPFPKKSVVQVGPTASKIDVSASSGFHAPALSEEDLRQAVTRIVLYGTLLESKHSAQDRDYRNISEDDILAMLEGDWSLIQPVEWNAVHRNWKYKLRGADLDGDELVLVVVVNTELNRIDVITKFQEEV